jgi:hypothetical protein
MLVDARPEALFGGDDDARSAIDAARPKPAAVVQAAPAAIPGRSLAVID